ncbi:MAG: VacJ family lipoprotein [Alphaproteobacteria bacterium]|nr:VacJ family lipoprotein [Alphaproteobacteria bacterium]
MTLRAYRRLAALAMAATLAAAPASAQQGPSGQAGEEIDPGRIEEAIAAGEAPMGDAGVDPWAGFNRNMFAVHNFFDATLLVPISLAYRHATPKRGRRGIRRFLANLSAPTVIINDLLQGEFDRARKTAGRFAINSTLGAGGFADPANLMGVEGHREDFGQTLAVWGVDSGPYLFLPLFGPSTARDLFGSGVQILFDPLFYVRTPPANIARYSRAGVGGIAAREPFIEPLADMRTNSLDYYASFRSFYLQNRQRQILNDRGDIQPAPVGDESLDELEAELDALDAELSAQDDPDSDQY